MRIFVAGAGGALGTQLVRHLVADRHEVIGFTRSASHAQVVQQLGVSRSITGDALNPSSIRAALESTRPEAVVHASYERRCQEKKSLPSPGGNQGMVTYIQPCFLLRGAFDLAALDRRVVQRRRESQLMIPTRWFHVTVALDASRLGSYASPALA